MDWPYRSSIAPQFAQVVQLGDVIALRGYDFAVDSDQASLALTLYWESLAATATNYKVFVHVLDAAGQIVAQVDQIPVNGIAPTHRWQPGDLIRDPYQITLPPDLLAGRYSLFAGLYTEADGRLTVEGDADNAVWLTEWEFRR
jgi:hypothetical protein